MPEMDAPESLEPPNLWDITGSEFGSSRMDHPYQWLCTRGIVEDSALHKRVLLKLRGLLPRFEVCTKNTFLLPDAIALPDNCPGFVLKDRFTVPVSQRGVSSSEAQQRKLKPIAAAIVCHNLQAASQCPIITEMSESLGRLLRFGKVAGFQSDQGMERDELIEIMNTLKEA